MQSGRNVAKSCPLSIEGWVKDIHNLGDPALAFGSTYNSALQKFTDKFVRTKVAGQVNLSSIGQVRTNEIAIGSPWELREFKLNANNGKLVNVTTKRTPLASDNNSVELANFINSNEKAILNETHNLKGMQTAKNALADFRVWDAPGIKNPEARFKFALNTCNGCHTSETSTSFVHLSLRQKGQVSQLSSFFQNVAVRDGKGVFRTFAEMKRRRLNLQSLIVLTQPGFSPQATLAETGLNAEQQLLSTDLPVGVEH